LLLADPMLIYAPQTRRTDSEQTTHLSGEMTLIVEAHSHRYLRNRVGAQCEKLPGPLDSLLNDESMRRNSCSAREQS
jgi:hypothetical protein